MTWNERGIIKAMSKKLRADGMYFVGIDVVGNEVVEINAESPGGMQRRKALRDRRLPNRHRGPGVPSARSRESNEADELERLA
jgi:Prokaryotic glutathione synthetase, ATP-grasp domain